jgi:hypothetical protein
VELFVRFAENRMRVEEGRPASGKSAFVRHIRVSSQYSAGGTIRRFQCGSRCLPLRQSRFHWS